MLENLVLKNRSYRRFKQEYRIKSDLLRELINLARQTPSATNLQPLKYIISSDPAVNARIFPCLSWAAKLNWNGPEEGERPSSYIVMLGDTNIAQFFAYDCGIAAQTILLGAVEKNLGGCMLGAINRDQLRKELAIPEQFEILLVIALGKPAEKVLIDQMEPGGDTSYWRDEKDAHHAPKRRLKEIIQQEY